MTAMIDGVLTALASTLLMIAMTAPAAPVAASPTSAWSFHGGGALLGQAADPGQPPMKLRWTYHADVDGDAAIEGAAALDATTAYVGDAKGVLHAIDLTTGQRRWTYRGGDEGFATTPLLLGGRVLIGDLSGTFHAVSADKGGKLWTLDTGAPVHASANAAAPDATRLVVANDAGKILCLDPADGAILWTAQAADRVNSAPAVVGDTVYVGGCDSKLIVLNLSDGKPRFDGVDLGAVIAGSPAVLGDDVVVGTDGGRVVCLARADGSPRWSYEQIKDGAMAYASPAVGDGVVVIGARDRHVHAINLADGKPRWTFKARLDVDSSPVIAGGCVYVGSKDKSLYVIDLKSGKLLWDFKASRGIFATPAIAGGVVVVGDTAGNVYCLEPADQ
jgi:eukaryotic-like serine/threonine-protein kinase